MTKTESAIVRAAVTWYGWMTVAPFNVVATKKNAAGALFRACRTHVKTTKGRK